MRAVLCNSPGNATDLYIGEAPDPMPGPNDLLVRVKSFALNRMDILQRRGGYPPPPGASEILGVEFAGTVVSSPSSKFKPGDRVFGLVPGGAYAELVTIHQDMTTLIPDSLSFDEAAAIPEVWFTAFKALFMVGRLQKGEDVLIHAGASGVGTAAIQLAKSHGARNIIVTAGSETKTSFCLQLGATSAINYKSEDFAARVSEITNGRGVDVAIDFVGASYWSKNIASLALDGRMVMLAFLGGAQIPDGVNLAPILRKRLQICGSTLRSRSLDFQVTLRDRFVSESLPKLVRGEMKPIIDRSFMWNEIVEAHKHMEADANIGKIIVNID